MKNIYNTSLTAFTLIELVVSITIFSIVMVSVISIFIFSSDLSGKIEINRLMQENTKNVVETIAEDIRKNGIQGISVSKATPLCTNFSGGVDKGDKLCTATSEYFLAKYDEVLSDWIRVNLPTDCDGIDETCTIIKHDGISKFPLTNSFITFKDISFYISGDKIQKVTLIFHAQPAAKKGVRADLIENNEFFFQTTISERIIDFK